MAYLNSARDLCVYCDQPDDKQENPTFQCNICKKIVHWACLNNRPSPLVGDVFFEFTCSTCSSEKKEMFARDKMTWVKVLILTLNHLRCTSQAMCNQGFFHYRTHIACFIDRNWVTFFGTQFKQKKNWIGTLVGVLSSHSGVIFQSSGAILGDQGWWRLMYKFSPALAGYILQEMSKDRAALAKSKRSKNNVQFTTRTISQIFAEAGYSDVLLANGTLMTMINPKVETERYPEQEVSETEPDPVPCKKSRVNSAESHDNSCYQSSDNLCNNVDSDCSYDYAETKPTACLEYGRIDELAAMTSQYLPTTTADFTATQQTHCDSGSRSRSPTYDFQSFNHETEINESINKQKESRQYEPKIELNETSLFSTQLNSIGKLPWLNDIETPDKSLMRLTEYEEIQLLKCVEATIPDVTNYSNKTYLRRLRAKLALRRLKRNKHLPLFDLDNTVRYLGGYSTEDPRISNGYKERVLDRFQSLYMCGTMNSMPATILVGNTDHTSFQSPYSSTILKPFIRRDTESSPLWLRLMDELLEKTKSKNPEYVPPARAPIDYLYVKPQHIAAVNNLCSQFFWPGVDVSESLQYPEFSCVVTYKKLVIGFAFLVPDVARNTAYISFIVTRPEWRHCKIATFMLYHLLQTCTGQDVTLHVSPTNPAVFLYQKFGFKVEELIQDFYEKYFEINSKDCKHALLLRLTR